MENRTKYFGPTFTTETEMVLFVEQEYNVEVLNVFEDLHENLNKEVIQMQVDTDCDKIYDIYCTKQDEKVVLIKVERIA